MRKLVIATLMLFAVSMAAQTPTGTVSFGYANGTCPQTTFNAWGSPATLDASGNYMSTTGSWSTLPAGTYCFRFVYSGDANTQPSTGYFTLVANPFTKNTSTTTGTIAPNPIVAGQTGTISGSVTVP